MRSLILSLILALICFNAFGHETFYKICNKRSGLVLTAADDDQGSAVVQAISKARNKLQYWIQEDRAQGKRFRLANTQLCLDIENVKGPNMIIWKCHNDANQLWNLQLSNGQFYRIQSKSDKNLYLDIQENKDLKAGGRAVVRAKRTKNPESQLWTFLEEF